MALPTGISPKSGDELPRFSQSQLGAYLGCTQRHWYNYHEGLISDRSTGALYLGTTIHRILEQHYLGNNPHDLLELPEFKDPQNQLVFARAMGLYQNYRHYAALNDNFRVAGVEIELLVEVTTPQGNRVLLDGRIDILGESSDGLFVMDHKSGATGWQFEEVYFDSQLDFYAIVARLSGHKVTKKVLNYINTREYKKPPPISKRFDRIIIDIDQGQLKRRYAEFLRLIDLILEARAPIPNLNKSCSRCFYKGICLTKQEGFDPGHYIAANFRHRDDPPSDVEVNFG